ncbi:MAG TPA: DegQ family serine endoprotease [Candidatus Acidoferrales bacterium]|jgi:serine protease Do|nr:DegQ family serine endoprotease [Candidatus Acidoferrales bacterium]
MNWKSLGGKSKFLAGALVVLVGLAGWGAARASQKFFTPGIHISMKMADPAEGPSKAGFAPVVKGVLPDVVNISTSKVVKASEHPEMQQGTPEDMPPFFQQFFGQQFGPGQGPGGRSQRPRDQREESLGSGVIVSPDGYILTNNHVIEGATDVRVTLADKRQLKAKVIGTDAKTDIAVLKVEGSDFPAITVGDSTKVQVGDYALAIGDPFGVGQTVTMGIISAMNRGNLGIEDYEDFIQTDAPINPGNSGGALINDRGELVGINTAILSHGSGGNEGIGFAIPINLARGVMSQILDHGKVNRAYLGIMVQDVTPGISKAMNLKDMKGVLVGDVTPNGPAQKSGVQRGDVILEVNGKVMEDSRQLRNMISMMDPTSTVNLKLMRNGNATNMSVKLGDMPADKEQASAEEKPSEQALNGVTVENLDAQTARQLGLSAAVTGVVVTDIDPSSALASAGLRQGDVIQEVNHQPVKNVNQFQELIRKAGDSPLLLVNRKGTTLFLAQ